MAWKDLTSLQKLNSGGLDAYVWNGQTAATQKQLLETINKRIKLRKETGSITTVKENPEQRAARKAKARKASGGSVKNYSYGGRVANYSKEKP